MFNSQQYALQISRSGSLLLILFLLSCSRSEPSNSEPLDIGFYHWQQTLKPDSLNQRLLDLSSEPVLFTKVCDLVWTNGRAEPRAVLAIQGDQFSYRLEPVVFVTNELMLELEKQTNTERLLEQLVDDLLTLIDNSLDGQAPWKQLQMDCDWTRGSANTYFQFLNLLKARLPEEVNLSATVRLHQWRDFEQQGVPPVDRGCLMAYNSGELGNWETENSILDTTIAAAYLQERNYPLSLDLALPLYRWGIIYRRGELAYLVNDLTAESLSDSSRFEAISEHRYRVKSSTYLAGIYCYKDDLIRLESSDSERLLATAQQLKIVPRFAGQRLLFFRQGGSVAENADTAFIRALAW